MKPGNVALEQEMERLDLGRLHQMNADGWYAFLHDEYFRWKYTAPNRYATTTATLRRTASQPGGLEALHRLRSRLLAINPAAMRAAIETAAEIPGLGTAGASGLLALLFPGAFGTVDQFVVRALRQVRRLPEAARVAKMNPEALTPAEGEFLVSIMRRQASILTGAFTMPWRPRDVDKVLWTYGRD